MTRHPHLLSPGDIGPLRLRNRIVLPAMDQNSCTHDGELTDRNIAHYEARARGGTGLLILETSAVAYPVGATSRHQPSLADDRCVPGLARLAESVHQHGARMVVQVCHHGKGSGVDAAEGRAQLVPSVPLPRVEVSIDHLTPAELVRLGAVTGGKAPTQREATTDDLAWVVEQFAAASARVQRSGLDGVEVHAGHGYLLSTFLSPKYNRRTDAYGGTAENRARLLCDVVGSIRSRCGDDFAVIVRIDASEHVDGGITLADAVEHAAYAELAGAHAIHVSATSLNPMGVGFTDGPLPWRPLQYVEYARAVKARVKVPVIAVGRIMPDDAEALLASGDVCDFVAMGRQLLADPDLADRLGDGRPDLVRTCINCFVCVAENFFDAPPVCAVNADLGHYDRPAVSAAAASRRVVVVGAGPAGLEAARVAAARGHRVIVLEKGSHVGGTARFSSLTTPMNGELVRYLRSAITELGVELRLGTTATTDAVRALGPDVVIVATGARRERPAVPGADQDHVLSGDDLRGLMTGDDPSASRRLGMLQRAAVAVGRRMGLTDDMAKVGRLSRRWMPLADRVAIVGGGLVGVELAEFLAERGRTVIVLEASDKLAVEMAHPRRVRALHEARARGVRFETSAEVTEIGDKTITFRRAGGGDSITVAAGSVLLATGVHADDRLAEALRGGPFEVHVIGDASEVGYIQGAIASGNGVGRVV